MSTANTKYLIWRHAVDGFADYCRMPGQYPPRSFDSAEDAAKHARKYFGGEHVTFFKCDSIGTYNVVGVLEKVNE